MHRRAGAEQPQQDNGRAGKTPGRYSARFANTPGTVYWPAHAGQYPPKSEERDMSTAHVISPPRQGFLDTFRGTAVMLMLVYHFCFDLNYFGVAGFSFQTDPFWLAFRSLIVTCFILAVGASLYLSTKNKLRPGSFIRRQVILGLAAGGVSLGSYLVFPLTWITFGVLHFIFVGRILGLLFLRFKTLNLVFASLFLLAGLLVQHRVFNHPWLHWLGMMTHKPLTEDYVPVLPWFGVLLCGLYLGRILFDAPGPLSGHPPLPSTAWLAWLGRHSLVIYLIHQPLFMASLYLILR